MIYKCTKDHLARTVTLLVLNIRGFSKSCTNVAMWHTCIYDVIRLPKSFVGECFGYFGYKFVCECIYTSIGGRFHGPKPKN